MPQSSLMAWLGQTPANGTKIVRLDEERKAATDISTPLSSSHAVTVSAEKSTRNGQQELHASLGSTGSPKAPANVEFRSCTKDDIPGLKLINSLLLPIPYPESFYKETIDDPTTTRITLLAIWHDHPIAGPPITPSNTISKTNNGSSNQVELQSSKLVGAIRCKILDSAKEQVAVKKPGPMLYLSTLVLLSPYRGHGIATHLLDVMVRRAVHEHGITSVGAHVWEANEEGRDWYRRRGFREVSKAEGYYRRLKPQTAIVVQRAVGIMDMVER